MRELQYPIGEFTAPEHVSDEQVREWIDDIETLPARLRRAVSELSPTELDTPYRPGGWTARQVVHHVPDSHLNSYVRFKWTLTEDEPTIKAYHEDRWAELADYASVPVESSLALLETLHARWVGLLRSLTSADLDRAFIHPETNNRVQLRVNVGIYAWHGRHHLAHLALVRGTQ